MFVLYYQFELAFAPFNSFTCLSLFNDSRPSLSTSRPQRLYASHILTSALRSIRLRATANFLFAIRKCPNQLMKFVLSLHNFEKKIASLRFRQEQRKSRIVWTK